MEIPFVVLDLTTGFHLASQHLRQVSTQTTSKGALAVLCSSIFHLWKNICDRDGESGGRGTSGSICTATFESCSDGFPATYFHSLGNNLCVVFGRKTHRLFELFAEELATYAAGAGTAGLRDASTAATLKGTAARRFLKEVCSNTESSLVVFSSTDPLLHLPDFPDRWKEHHSVLMYCLSEEGLTGMLVMGNLVLWTKVWGSARLVVAGLGARTEDVAKLGNDDLLAAMLFDEGRKSKRLEGHRC